ncbi:MAG: hypothetical protein EOM28_08290 [Clostridia bacterium]|nr:hypothetical protein [Clostridia bacterium]
MNYKQAKNYLKKHRVTLVYAPVSRLSISLTDGSMVAMIQQDRIVHDTKKAATKLMKFLRTKNAPTPTTAHGAKPLTIS